MDKRSVEPLHVVALREAEQHLIGQDRNGQQKNGARGDRQRERAQPQPARGDGERRLARASVLKTAEPVWDELTAPACTGKGQSDTAATLTADFSMQRLSEGERGQVVVRRLIIITYTIRLTVTSSISSKRGDTGKVCVRALQGIGRVPVTRTLAQLVKMRRQAWGA